MNELLVPSSEFRAPDLGRQLHRLVSSEATAESLAARGMYGVIRRYSSTPEAAIESVTRGQSAENPRHLVVVNTFGDAVGAASVYESLTLEKSVLGIAHPAVRRLREKAPHLAAQLALGALEQLNYRQYPYATHNVEGWTAADHADLLPSVYRELVKIHTPETIYPADVLTPQPARPWTIERVNSSPAIHEAIAYSGLTEVGVGHFDDQEGGRRMLKRSTLYAQVYGRWYSRHGRLKELETGARPILSILPGMSRD